jgi:patatin-like phospholipase/acyl hydrolase
MDAAMATAAAPAYFRNRSITANGHQFIFEDAGAHGANNPTVKAWVELKAWAKLEPDGGPSCLVSIGTGGNKMAKDSPTRPRNGTARRVVNNLFNARLRAKELSRGLLYQATDVEEVDELMKSYTKGTDK